MIHLRFVTFKIIFISLLAIYVLSITLKFNNLYYNFLDFIIQAGIQDGSESTVWNNRTVSILIML